MWTRWQSPPKADLLITSNLLVDERWRIYSPHGESRDQSGLILPAVGSQVREPVTHRNPSAWINLNDLRTCTMDSIFGVRSAAASTSLVDLRPFATHV